MSQLMFEDIVDFVEDYPREFRAQFARMKNFDAAIRNIIERFHEKRQEVFDNSTQRPSEKLERLKSLDSEYLGKAEELQVKKLQILKALKHAVTVVQRKINDSVDAHRQELRFEHPGAAERIEYDSRQLDIDQDATVKQLYKDLIPSASGLSLNSSSSGGAGANNILTSLLEYVPTYYRSPGVVENTLGAAAAGVASGSGGANNNELGDETESLGSTTHGGRVRSDGGGYDDKGNEKKRGRGRPRRNKELDDGGASTLSGIDEDEEASPAAGYSGLGTANSKGGPGGGTNDEEVWCFCKQPSFGFMVACDGADGVGCAIEWFHGDCVHVREEDMENVERWFCPMCREKLVQMHAGNVSSEALNNSNVDANERAQNALETMSQATTTSSAAVNGKGRLSMVDDEASTSSVGEMGFSSNRKRKRPTIESSSKASSSTTTHHKKSKHPHQPPNGKAHIGRPPKKSHRKS